MSNYVIGSSIFSTFQRLYRFLPKRRRLQLGLVFALMLAGAFAELATIGALIPFLGLISSQDQLTSNPIVSDVIGMLGWANADNLTTPLTVFFVVIVLIAGSIRIMLAWVSQKYAFRIGHDLSVSIYRSGLYKPFIYHALHNSSDMIAGITKSQNIIISTVLPMLQAGAAVVLSITVLGALLAIDAGFALSLVVGIGGAYGAISFFSKSWLDKNGRDIALAQTERIKAVQEGLGGIRDVLIDNAQEEYIGRFAEKDLALRDANTNNAFISSSPRFVIESISIVLVAISALVLSGKQGGLPAALPLLGALALGAQRTLPAINSIFQSWSQIRGNQQKLIDVLDLIDVSTAPAPHLATRATPLPFVDDICLTDVSFKYCQDDDLVVENVNLRIKKGSCVAFIGKTGSGKSTIVDLIMGLLEPASGQITIDSTVLTQDNIAGWQTNIAHVAQHVYLADISLAENIAFGVPPEKIDHNLVQFAARKAAILDSTGGLLRGSKTIAGERGVRLSGGQKQRIGIARAIYKQVPVLIFDEATSALDDETEFDVMKAIRSLGPDITILIIAHRASTIRGCDQVFRVEKGKVMASTIEALDREYLAK